jgi:TetR/AcrR family transcriptional repressor of nem operon
MTQKPDTRQRILDTAADLFHRYSYDAVGIAMVCEQAGVSKGSFFHFFASKRDLALAVMDQFRDLIADTLIARAFSPKYSPLDRIDRFVKELHTFQKTLADLHGHVPGCPFGNLVMEQATQDEALRVKGNGCLNFLGGHLQAAIAEAAQNGDLPPLDEEATADAMLSYLEGIQLLAKARNDPGLIRRLGPAVKSLRVHKKA